jgi:hypothetical protein
MESYLRVRTARFFLWGLFAVAIPMAIVFRIELPADFYLRFIPFGFLFGALAAGFAERRVRLRHSLPPRRFGRALHKR